MSRKLKLKNVSPFVAMLLDYSSSVCVLDSLAVL